MARQTAALLTAKRQPTAAEMTQDIAPASETFTSSVTTGAVRKATESGYSLEFSPTQVMKALRSAQAGTNLEEFVRVASVVLRRSAKLRSVLTTRVLAVTGLPRVVEPGDTRLKSRKAAEACQALTRTPQFKGLLRHLMWAVYYGWSGAQTIYGKGAQEWPVEAFKPIPQQWFMFDPNEGDTPMLVPQEPGEQPQPLDVFGKFVFHAPSILPGQPYLNGIAYTAVFYAALVHVVLKQGTQFVELFGQPMRLGKFPKGDTEGHKKDRAALRKALESLGADAWAMIPEDMQIEFLKDATVGGSIDVYERWARYFDELLAGLVLGASLTSGTGNTGSGGSQALGVVHNELRADLMRADADDLADTISRDVFAPFVAFNFGPDVAVPIFRMPVEEAEDITAWVDATDKAMRNGLRVPAEEFYARLNIRAPKDGEEVLGGTPAPTDPNPTQQANTARFAAANDERDELDDLIDELVAEDGFTKADADADEQLLAAIENAANADELKAALLAAVRTGNVEGLQAVFTAGTTAARVAGDEGAELGDQ